MPSVGSGSTDPQDTGHHQHWHRRCTASTHRSPTGALPASVKARTRDQPAFFSDWITRPGCEPLNRRLTMAKGPSGGPVVMICLRPRATDPGTKDPETGELRL